jgi:hypothetical protein
VIWLASAFRPFEGGAGFLEGVALIAFLFAVLILGGRRRTRREEAQKRGESDPSS